MGVVARARVGVAACFRERFAAGEEARAGGEALCDGFGERVGCAAEVAYGGESALDHAFKDGDSAEDSGGRGELRVGGDVHHAGDDVDVAVDEAGDDGAAFDVDDLAGGGGGFGVEVADEAAFNEDVAGARVGAGGVDNDGVLQKGLHGEIVMRDGVGAMAEVDFDSVDDYIDAQPMSSRKVLERVRATIRRAIPKAEETISYGIPTYKVDGAVVVYFAGWKKHYSLYPVSASVLAECSDVEGSYTLEKSTIRFPLGEPVPVGLIECIVKVRARGLAAREKKATRR